MLDLYLFIIFCAKCKIKNQDIAQCVLIYCHGKQ